MNRVNSENSELGTALQKMTAAIAKHFTFKHRFEAENVVAALGLVALAVRPEAGIAAGSATGLAGLGDRVLDGAVVQPAGVAPVKAAPPRLEELVEGGHRRVLAQAGLLCVVEVQVVAAQAGGVWEYYTYCGQRT